MTTISTVSALALTASTSFAQCDNETFKLLASDGAVFDQFGRSVAISGTTAIVGAPWDGNLRGSTYLFDTITGAQITKLLASDGAADDQFGRSVAISGTTAIVGAYQDDDLGTNSGSAYLFDITTGLQIAKLLASDGAAGDAFGRSVAISDATATVGAPWNDDLGSDSGSAYLFDVTTGLQTAKLLPSDGETSDDFGGSVGISGGTAIAGARNDDDLGDYSGSAYLFFTSSLGTNYCDVNPNSTGLPAIISACGSASIADNNFGLSAMPVPNQTYLFVHADNQVKIPFGNGLLCADGGITRLNPPRFAVGNLASRVVDLPSAGISVAGTFNFQCWFRDPAAGGATFNTSNGLSVTFVP